jgi:hypothetical protein
MMLYSLIQFSAVTLAMVLKSYLSEIQYLSVDIFILIPLAFFIPATGPHKFLTKDRPNQDLISFAVLSSVLSEMILCFIFQLVGRLIPVNLLYKYKNVCLPDSDSYDILACPDNTYIFLMSNVQYFIVSFVFCTSKPFKAPLYTNYFLTAFMILAVAYSSLIILWPSKFVCKILQLYSCDDPYDSYYDTRRHDFDGQWDEEEEGERDFTKEEYYSFKNPSLKYFLFGLAILNFITCMVFERLIMPAFTWIWNFNKFLKLKQRRKVEDKNNFTMQELFQLSEEEP